MFFLVKITLYILLKAPELENQSCFPGNTLYKLAIYLKTKRDFGFFRLVSPIIASYPANFAPFSPVFCKKYVNYLDQSLPSIINTPKPPSISLFFWRSENTFFLFVKKHCTVICTTNIPLLKCSHKLYKSYYKTIGEK